MLRQYFIYRCILMKLGYVGTCHTLLTIPEVRQQWIINDCLSKILYIFSSNLKYIFLLLLLLYVLTVIIFMNVCCILCFQSRYLYAVRMYLKIKCSL